MPVIPGLIPSTSRRCSSCGQVVARSDCHRNRYGQYICRTCQYAGVRSTGLRRLRRLARSTFSGFWYGMVAASLVALLLWTLYLLAAHGGITRMLGLASG